MLYFNCLFTPRDREMVERRRGWLKKVSGDSEGRNWVVMSTREYKSLSHGL